ncbi:MAG: sugar ABC transporter substrate-binding protein [Lachnospiraceae bacterium]|nr:sugar ABC transporter substrate-binding protein [Lachnospiraceae bacterium]
MKKKIISICLLLCLTAGVCLGAKVTAGEQEVSLFSGDKALTLWYTDEALTNYLESAAFDYQEQTGKRIVPVLVSGLEYLEKIHEASMEGNGPDLYIMSNDTLEKAYLAGLSSPIRDEDGIVNEEHYPLPALWAVSYQDKQMGYPFYYETSILLYNQTYIENLAKDTLLAEANEAEGEAAMAAIEAAGSEEAAEQDVVAEAEEIQMTEEEIAQTMDRLIPTTIEGILSFAEDYDAPEQVEAVFQWDVSDIFYNYFVVGNYITVGGNAGDNPENIHIYNEDAMKCLAVYQKLNQFFSIEPDEVTYESVLKEFIEGKTVFAVATTDAIEKIEEAKAAGEFAYEYGAAMLPDVNEELKSKSLSVTNAVVINGYGEQKESAEAFAEYVAFERAENLYDRTGKISARKGIVYENDRISIAMKEYENSVPIPKMMETSSFWVQLEIAFSNIWTGADVNETLRTLSEQIMTQITGREYQEEVLPSPVLEEEELEE